MNESGKDVMLRRRVGREGPVLSSLVYGTGSPKSPASPEDRLTRIRAALEVGITAFDTADVYGRGRSEELLSEALRGVPRHSVQILTKVGFPTGPGRADRGLSRGHILAAADGSLRRLRTEYIDLYQAHVFDPHTPIEESMQAFAALVRAGKVRYVGLSGWPSAAIKEAAGIAGRAGVPLVAHQVQYSMLWRTPESEVMPSCAEVGIAQLAWSPLCQGVLSGKYRPGEPAPRGSRGADDVGASYVDLYSAPDLLRRVQRLDPLAADIGLTLAQLAIAWTLANPNVGATIIGASTVEQIRENADAIAHALDERTMAEIDDILDDFVERDPAKITDQYATRPNWRRPPDHVAGEGHTSHPSDE